MARALQGDGQMGALTLELGQSPRPQLSSSDGTWETRTTPHPCLGDVLGARKTQAGGRGAHESLSRSGKF